MALLLNFEPHYKALIRVLREAYVTHNISMEKVDQLVSNIVVSNVIAFAFDEIPLKGVEIRRLYISLLATKGIHYQKLCFIMGPL